MNKYEGRPILEQAQLVARDLAEFNRIEKATQEAYKLQSGRGRSPLLEALEIDDNQLNRAIESLNKVNDDLYLRITANLNRKDY